VDKYLDNFSQLLHYLSINSLIISLHNSIVDTARYVPRLFFTGLKFIVYLAAQSELVVLIFNVMSVKVEDHSWLRWFNYLGLYSWKYLALSSCRP